MVNKVSRAVLSDDIKNDISGRLQKAQNLADLPDRSQAQISLGLVPDVTVQSYSDKLDAVVAMGAADRVVVTTSGGNQTMMGAAPSTNLFAIGAAGFPNDNDLGVSGDGVARRDNVKAYVDPVAPAILPSRMLFDNAAGTTRESVTRSEAVNRLGLGSLALPLRKLFPTAMYIEMGGFFSTSAQTWLDGNGNPAMTAAFWRSKIDDAVAAGVEHVVVGYLEGWGNFYYPPSFAFWDGYETGSAIGTKYWRDNIPALDRPNFENFDPVEVLLERCDFWGIKCWLGIGRQGDVELMGDLFGQAVVPGWTDPMRVGFTLAQRLTRAKTRILMMAQDLFNLYGDHPSLAGFKPGHEPTHIPSANQYYIDVVKNGFGGYPSLTSYQANGLSTMIVPARLLETGVDITDATYAQAVVDNGSDVWAWQDAAGPGYNYVLSDYTWLPSVTFSLGQTDNVQAYGERLRIMINRANNYARINNRRLEHWAIGEVWRMGRRPVAVLSIGAGYNTPGMTGVTFSATGAFTDAQVGSIITTSGGKATVTDISSVPNSVAATINRAFSANSFARPFGRGRAATRSPIRRRRPNTGRSSTGCPACSSACASTRSTSSPIPPARSSRLSLSTSNRSARWPRASTRR